jgi:hypothetical protein
MAGVVQYLATFGDLGRVRELHLRPSGLTGLLPWPEHPYSLKRNFPFHWRFLDLLLSGSDLKRRGSLRREGAESSEEKKPQCTEV